MSPAAPLKQHRAAILFKIKVNPFTLTLRRPTASTAPGSGAVRYGAPYSAVPTNSPARIAFRKSSIPEDSQGTPIQSDRAWFMLTTHKAKPEKGDQLTDGIGRHWEVLTVSPIAARGGVVGYESELRVIDGTS